MKKQVSVLLMTSLACFAQSLLAQQEVVDLSGSIAPLRAVIEAFFTTATATGADPDSFSVFCEEYGIDSTWPSAAALLKVLPELDREYGSRLQEAADSSDGLDAEGLDPNEWKARQLGREFGRIHSELRKDGLRMNLHAFLKMVEARVRPTFSLHSDAPFDAEEGARLERLFELGLADTGEPREEGQ